MHLLVIHRSTKNRLQLLLLSSQTYQISNLVRRADYYYYYYYYYYKCQDYSDTIVKHAAGALYKTLCQNLQLTLCNK